MLGVGHRADRVGQRPQRAQRGEQRVQARVRPGPAHADQHHRPAVQARRQPRRGRGVPQVHDRAQLPGSRAGQRGVRPENRAGLLGRERQHASNDLRPDAVDRQVQPGDHAEVGARAAQRPQQVGVVGGLHHLAAGRDQLGAGEVVAGGPAAARQPADPAAEGETGQPGVADDARRGGQAVALGGRVELAVQHAGARHREPPPRVDPYLAELPQVDHQPAVADGPPGDAVAARPHRDRQVMGACEADRGHDVRGVPAAGDHRRVPVDGAVPDPAGLVVAGIGRVDDSAPQAGPQRRAGARRGVPAVRGAPAARGTPAVCGTRAAGGRAVRAMHGAGAVHGAPAMAGRAARCRARRAATCSATMITGMLVLAEGISGRIDASATDRPGTP
jgi:hypothetical protein